MIQVNYLLRRRKDLSDTAFECACDDYLTHVIGVQQALGFESASLTKTVDTPYQECLRSAHRLVPNQFDALLTLHWIDWPAYADATGHADGLRAHDELAALEARFFDRSHSQIFISESLS